MAEGSTTEPTTTTTGGEGAAQGAAQPNAQDTVTREEYDKLLAESRKWESRAKENKDAAKKLAELEDSTKTDAEKLADAEKRAEELQAQVEDYERKAERAGIVSKVAAEKGVDAEWLARMVGDTEEEVDANADFIKSKLSGAPIYPSVPDGGSTAKAPITREQIDAIKDPKERVRMRAQHLDLYKTKKK